MKIEVVSQVAGSDTHAVWLNKLLVDGRFTRLRMLIAFARWSGLDLIDANLQRFASVGRVDSIVGVDLGGTTIEALTYLSELPNSAVRIVRMGRPDVVFHPKLYMFDGDSGWVTIAGSANLTTGGLFKNGECSIVVTGRQSETNPFESTWRQFAVPEAPLVAEHLIEVTDRVLAELAPTLDAYTKRPPDEGKRQPGIPPITLSAQRPPVGRPPVPAKRTARPVSRVRAPVTTTAVPPGGRGELYMELWDETRDGTQVMVAKKVFTDFFGCAANAVTYLTLRTPDGLERSRLQAFPANSTYRVSLHFVGKYPTPGRRGVLRFVRRGKDTYDVAVRLSGARGYSAWLSRCTERRGGSKAYGIYV